MNFILQRLKTIVLSIIGVFRRALCCFSRQRTLSDSNDEVLQAVNVVNQDYRSSGRKNDADRDWNSWDDSPRTVEEHIEKYRQKLAQKNGEKPPPEPEPDFFGDMEPKEIKQTRVFIATEEQQNSNLSRITANLIPDIPIRNELEDWDDENVGWDEMDDENTKQLIREKRKEMRSQRQKTKDKNYR